LDGLACLRASEWRPDWLHWLAGLFHCAGLGMGSQAALFREVVRGPYRPLYFRDAWRQWQDSTILRIAQGVYEDRAFHRLPILADTLLDSGCDSDELIAHCHSPGPHVRGCWAVDLILGKS
jgi:hypothetical protein